MIPKILHQTGPSHWRSNETWKQLQPSWLEHHPLWTYYFWSDEQNDAFVHDYFPHFYDLYRRLPYEINRVDMVRYLYLYEYGGFYADLDTKCCKPLDPLLHHELVLGQQSLMGYTGLECAVMGSAPKQEIWLQVIQYISECLPEYASCPLASLQIINTTGPFMLTRFMRLHRPRNLVILEQDAFFPPLLLDSSSSKSFTVHYSGKTWLDNEFERRLANLHSWKPYGPYIIWILLLVVVVTGAALFWKLL